MKGLLRMKRFLIAAFASFVVLFASAAEWTVSDFAGLVSAVAEASSGDTIKMKAGTFTVAAAVDLGTKGLTLSGGWNNDFSAQGADDMTALDGAGTSDIFTLNNAAGATVTFERFVFTRAYTRAVEKTGTGDIVVTDCRFEDNGQRLIDNSWRGDYGRALYLSGSDAAVACISNCTFAGNVMRGWTTDPSGLGDEGNADGGGAVDLRSLRRAFFDNCLFVSNGIAWSATLGDGNGSVVGAWNQIRGSTFFAHKTPVTMRGTRFLANRGVASIVNSRGSGIVNLYDYGSAAREPSAFTNCLFTGNQELFGRAPSSSQSGYNIVGVGPLVVELGNASRRVDLVNCTFAYNICDAYRSGCISVRAGSLRIRNSILFGNYRWYNGIGGADLTLSENGYAEIDHTLLTSSDASSVLSLGANNLTLGSGVIYGDPSFETSKATVDALVLDDTKTNKRTSFRADAFQSVLAFDLHLKSRKGYYPGGGPVQMADVDSIAIDAGDPAASYIHELLPNGNRLNLGRYGNTAEASHSQAVAPTIDGFDISFPNGYSRPLAVVTMGSTGEGTYNADVTVTYTVGAKSVANVWAAVHPGDVLTAAKSAYFEPGATLTVSAVAKVAGFADVVSNVTMTVGGAYPPWHGHGGGANVIHVRAGADGENNGSDWLNAYADLKTGLAALGGTKTELWIAGSFEASSAPNALNPDVEVVLRGGFTGVEDTPAARAANVRAAYSGNGANDLISLNNAHKMTFERLEFRRGSLHTVLKTGGAGSLVFDTCVFADTCINSAYGGVALQAKGTAEADLVITNTLFAGNVSTSTTNDPRNDDGYGVNGGTAVRLCKFRSVTIADSTFVTNGIAYSQSTASGAAGLGHWNPVYGSTMLLQDAPLAMSGCVFRANRGATAGVNNAETGGGVVYLRGSGNGTTVRNCLFVGNEEIAGREEANHVKAMYGYGALVIGFGAAHTATVDNCTFAYNLSGNQKSAAGLTVHTGAATVRNSIFYGNRRYDAGEGGADLAVLAGGSADVDFTRFTANSIAYVTSSDPTKLVLGTGVSYGDPVFVTDLATATDAALLKKSSSTATGKYYYDLNSAAAVLAFDVHLKSKLGYWLNDGTYVSSGDVNSPSLDAGDPAASYANEPDPNGSRLNQGAYGNTARASHSTVSTPELSGVGCEFPNGYSRPDVSVALKADEAATYAATITVSCGTGNVAQTGYQYVKTISGAHAGDVTAFNVTSYFTAGDDLTVVVRIESSGAETIEETYHYEVTGVYPPWFGHGGGANVIHLRKGADGKGTGANWTDAFADLNAAVAALGGAKTELWIAGSNVVSSTPPQPVFTNSVSIRGGFTGLEDAAADRVPGALSTLDGGEAYDILNPKNADGATITIERLEFIRAKRHAVNRARSAGDIVITGCTFRNNAPASHMGGLALQIAGDFDSAATVADCVFTENYTESTTTDPAIDDDLPLYDDAKKSIQGGTAVRFLNLRQATVTGSLFTGNGIRYEREHYTLALGYWNVVRGSTLLALRTPVTFRNCAFRANRGATGQVSASGEGVVTLYGASGASAFTNCQFVANQELNSQYEANMGAVKTSGFSGALAAVLNDDATLDVANCTFAFNSSDSVDCASALTVNGGTAHVTDSIFWGNRRAGGTATSGADIRVNKGAATVDWTLLPSNSEFCVNAASGATCALSNVIYGEPKFVTETESVATNYVLRYRGGTLLQSCFDLAHADEYRAINLHLRGRGYLDEKTGKWTPSYPKTDHSPAIDAGDPVSTAWKLEPAPNGKRLNLGVYGGTPYATKSIGNGMLLIVR